MLRSMLVAGTLLAATLLAGCAARVTYRTYDPYYRDYHVWGYAETPYYQGSLLTLACHPLRPATSAVRLNRSAAQVMTTSRLSEQN